MVETNDPQIEATPEEQSKVDLFALAEAILAMLKKEALIDQERLGRG